MRWTSPPSACLTFRTATRPARRSSITSETIPAWRATWVSTTGSPVTLVRRRTLFLFDSVVEQQDAQSQEQRVEGDQQAEPLADVRWVEPGHTDRRAGRLDGRQD